MSPHTDTFSVQDAKDAGLWGQRTWKTFAKDMLLNRAFGRAARRRFADSLNGIHVAEEMQDAQQVKNVPSQVVNDVAAFTIPCDDTQAIEQEILTESEILALDGSVDVEA
jgi:hypothetical protein